MNRNTDIEFEWNQLAPGLAKSGFMPVPYRAPDGYFQSFFDRLMMRIRTEESGGLISVSSVDQPEEMSATDEIAVISPLLAGLSRKMPYQVPDNYFAQFQVSEEKSVGILADFHTAMPLDLSTEESKPDVVANALTTEPFAPEIAPFVPKTAAITPKIAPVVPKIAPFVPKIAPVIQMNHHRSWKRIAAAAIITAVILSGAFFYLRPSQTSVPGELAQVSDQDMENYMASQDLPAENITDSNSSQVVMGTAQPFNDNEISDLMSNVTDNELEAYATTDGPNSNLN